MDSHVAVEIECTCRALFLYMTCRREEYQRAP